MSAARFTPIGQARDVARCTDIPGLGTTMLIMLSVAMALTGCGRSAGVIFDGEHSELRWPPSPEKPRVQYIGQLSSSADLKPGANFFELLEETLFGEDEVRTMLSPFAICSDDHGRVFVADSNAQLVHMFDLRSRKYARLKPPRDQPGLSQPVGVACDGDGRLFVSDSVAGEIVIFNPDGSFESRVGTSVLNRPTGICLDRATGRLYVADTGMHQIVVLSQLGEELARIGKRGTELGSFNFPTSVVLDQRGRLLVCDSLNFRVQVFSDELEPLLQIGSKGDVPGYFSQPKGIAVDPDNNIYVVDAHFENLQVFSDEGVLLMAMGHEGHGLGEFWLPAGVHVDESGRIWVADVYNRRVQVFDYLPNGDS